MGLLSSENSEPCIPSAYCAVGQKHWLKQLNPQPCSGQASPNITPILCSQLDYAVLQCKLILHCCKPHLTLMLLPKCENTGESIMQPLPTLSNVTPTPSHLYSAMFKYPTQPTSNKAYTPNITHLTTNHAIHHPAIYNFIAKCQCFKYQVHPLTHSYPPPPHHYIYKEIYLI